ncbi:MAG: hypothetical protein HYX33_03820, partial [Actinobacteria bacterium]|nr:hypothetical protein [Actinomycetota bacterium]
MAITFVGCGGGGGNKATSAGGGGGGGGASPTSTDVNAILAAAKANPSQQGPTQAAVNVSISLKSNGSNPSLAAFTDKPITLRLSGPSDPQKKKSDLTFSVVAGPLNLSGRILQDGDKGWVKLADQWYKTDAATTGTTTGTTTSPLDTKALLGAFGDPKTYIKNAKFVGTESVEGVASDHLQGDLDVAGLADAFGKAAAASGGSAGPISSSQITQLKDGLTKVVKSATVDLWIGQSDKLLRKVAFTAEGATAGTSVASSGLQGFSVKADISATPTTTPTVSPPSNAKPLSDLAQGLGGILGGLGGSTA